MAVMIPFLIALLVAFAAGDSNVMLTGDVIPTDGQLSYGTNSFIIQDDCNLVLYNNRAGFQSNTHGYGVNCTLTLNDVGQLAINSAGGSTVWTSGSQPSKKGRYAAVMRPDGQVAVYGPSLWSTPPQQQQGSSEEASFLASLAGSNPMARNVLFSSQVMNSNAMLETRDYKLEMVEDCNLVLSKGDPVFWQSWTAGKGRHCFLRLDHRGELSVVDDKYKTVWATKPVGKQDGDYVLVLEIHGQAVVYGPVVWSTSSS